MTDFDQVLEQGFQEASGRKNMVRAIEAKIAEIPGAKSLLPSRRYGEPVSAEEIRANLTLRSLIEQKSPQLAVYFGLDAGVAHRRLEEKAARELLDQRDAAVAEREWLMHELAQLSGTDVATD